MDFIQLTLFAKRKKLTTIIQMVKSQLNDPADRLNFKKNRTIFYAYFLNLHKCGS